MKKGLFFFIGLMSFTLFAQSDRPLFLTFSSKGGILMAHRPHMAHLVQKNAYGFELSIAKQQTENSLEAFRGKKPLNGLSFEYRNFGNDDVLGKAFSLMQYQDFPILQTKNSWFVDFKMGAGIGFLTKFYDKELNPTNNAIGSHLNAKVSYKLELNKFTDKLNFGLGLELSHFSNGAMQTPNLGLNNLSTYFNIGYNFSKRELHDENESFIMTMEIPKSYFLFEGIFTVVEVPPIPFEAKKYPVFAGRFSWVKPANKTWNFEMALDVVYNASNLYRYYDLGYTVKDVPQVGGYLGMSFNYYKSQIVFGMGYYFVDKINPLGRIYDRIGYRYYFNKKWCGLFNIRANFGKADFFEFGVGYNLGR